MSVHPATKPLTHDMRFLRYKVVHGLGAGKQGVPVATGHGGGGVTARHYLHSQHCPERCRPHASTFSPRSPVPLFRITSHSHPPRGSLRCPAHSLQPRVHERTSRRCWSHSVVASTVSMAMMTSLRSEDPRTPQEKVWLPGHDDPHPSCHGHYDSKREEQCR